MYDEKLLKSITNFFAKNNQHIAVAESVTSGHLQSAFSLAENASEFFQGGITVYNAIQKFKHLHVNMTEAISCNSVSPTIAEQMALNVSKSFASEWGIGITGYAAPLEE